MKIKQLIRTLILLASVVCLTNCIGTNVTFVKHGDPVQIRKTIKKAKVWVNDKNGVRREAIADLDAGLWVLADPGE